MRERRTYSFELYYSKYGDRGTLGQLIDKLKEVHATAPYKHSIDKMEMGSWKDGFAPVVIQVEILDEE